MKIRVKPLIKNVMPLPKPKGSVTKMKIRILRLPDLKKDGEG